MDEEPLHPALKKCIFTFLVYTVLAKWMLRWTGSAQPRSQSFLLLIPRRGVVGKRGTKMRRQRYLQYAVAHEAGSRFVTTILEQFSMSCCISMAHARDTKIWAKIIAWYAADAVFVAEGRRARSENLNRPLGA